MEESKIKDCLFIIDKFDIKGEYIKDYCFQPYKFLIKYKYNLSVINEDFTLFKEGELKEKIAGWETNILFWRLQIDYLNQIDKVLIEYKTNKPQQIKQGTFQLIFYLFLVKYKYGWENYTGLIKDVITKNSLKEICLWEKEEELLYLLLIGMKNLIEKKEVEKCSICSEKCSLYLYCKI